MAFWFWVVTLSVFALILYELIMWARSRSTNNAVLAAGGTGGENLAELTRANMKIAVLESRLEESSEALEHEKVSQKDLWQSRLNQTESAYQKQMAALHERLTQHEDALLTSSDESEYEVRMAGEVDAWLNPDEESPPITEADDPVAQSDLEAYQQVLPPAEAEAVPLDASPDDPDDPYLSPAGSEDSHDPAQERGLEEAIMVHAAQETSYWVGEASSEPELQTQIRLLDDENGETAASTRAVKDPVEGVNLSIKSAATNGNGDLLRYDKEDRYADAANEDGRTGERENRRSSGSLPDGWTGQHERAVVRALARRLGAEMDADYLDDDEFLQVIGLEQVLAAIGVSADDQLEAMMNSDDWTVDPLEVMKRHLAEQETADDDDADAGSEADAQQFVTDIWEAMVFASAEEARGDKSAAQPAAVTDEPTPAAPADSVVVDQQDLPRAEYEPPAVASNPKLSEQEINDFVPGWDDDDLDDDEAVAAIVDAILSRAAGVNGSGANTADGRDGDTTIETEEPSPESPVIEEDLPVPEETSTEMEQAEAVEETAEIEAVEPEPVPVEPTVQTAVGAVMTGPVVTGPVETGGQYPTWKREHSDTWTAEYFNNTDLSGDPVVVRQDRKIDFEWGEHPPAQGIKPRVFSVRWMGSVPLEPGQYRFKFAAPDGVRLWLNGRLVISAWYDQSHQQYRREFSWNGGPVEVRLEHYENGGDASARLIWESID